MRGYRSGSVGAVLDCVSIEQKQKFEDENLASPEDEPLKHIKDHTENSSKDSTIMKEPVLVQ